MESLTQLKEAWRISIQRRRREKERQKLGVKRCAGRSVSGVKSSSLVPLHVTNAPHWLDLRQHSPELRTLLILSFLKQVLIASVSWVLITHPAVKKTSMRRWRNMLYIQKANVCMKYQNTAKYFGFGLLTCQSSHRLRKLSHGIHERESWGHHHLWSQSSSQRSLGSRTARCCVPGYPARIEWWCSIISIKCPAW